MHQKSTFSLIFQPILDQNPSTSTMVMRVLGPCIKKPIFSPIFPANPSPDLFYKQWGHEDFWCMCQKATFSPIFPPNPSPKLFNKQQGHKDIGACTKKAIFSPIFHLIIGQNPAASKRAVGCFLVREK